MTAIPSLAKAVQAAVQAREEALRDLPGAKRALPPGESLAECDGGNGEQCRPSRVCCARRRRTGWRT